MIEFTDVRQLAQFLAEIVRQGMTYEVKRIAQDGCLTVWTVKLTGGY